MPRKAKEKDIENEVINEKESKTKRTTRTKKTIGELSKKDDILKETNEITPAKKTSRKKKSDTNNTSSNNVDEKNEKKATSSAKSTKKAKKSTSSKKDGAVSTKSTKTVPKTASSKKATKKSDDTTIEKATKSASKTNSSKKIAKKTDDTVIASTTKSTSTTKAKKSTTAAKPATSSRKKVEKTSEKKATSSAKRKTSASTKNKTSKTQNNLVQVAEYYDLPYSYGNTIVKLLAQTPKTLFVYWEVSDIDIKNFKEQYGEDFFNITKPILIVKNLTLNKITEVEINDFANCWYLNTEDSDCKFDIELARKFIKNTPNNTSENQYLPIAKSNNLLTPNDHIMFEKLNDFITFTDTSTGETIKKNIKSFKFLKDLYEFYKNMYNDEILKNPSSNFNF